LSVAERTTVPEGRVLADRLESLVDDRTLDILKRRRGSAGVRHRGWLVRRALVAADVVALLTAFVAAEFVVGGGGFGLNTRAELLLFTLTIPGWVVVAKLYGLYDRDDERADHSTVDDVVGVFHMVTLGSWLFFAGARATGLADPDLSKVFGFWIGAIGLITAARILARALCRSRAAYLQNAIIVGTGDVGRRVARKIRNHPEYGINVVGFVEIDEKRKDQVPGLSDLRVIGHPAQLQLLIPLLDVERVVIALPTDSHEELANLVRPIQDLDVQIDVVPQLFELLGPGVELHTVEGIPLLGLPRARLGPSSMLLKRSTDLILGGLALLLLAPLFALIAISIKIDSPGPVFFRQVRMGTGNRTFRIFKFRSMVAEAEEQKEGLAHLNRHAQPAGDPRMFKIDDDPRVTRVGRLLRRYALDEFPQLLNVLRGEMSLVGPRPLVLNEDQYVNDWGRKRLALKPGMTGLWQVLGSSSIPFDEMVKLDYLYVTSWTLSGDLRLVLRTLPIMLRGGNERV
jgi:exopolysaccharide biosynthesis polyprenyl glycosylphosphotransferase